MDESLKEKIESLPAELQAMVRKFLVEASTSDGIVLCVRPRIAADPEDESRRNLYEQFWAGGQLFRECHEHFWSANKFTFKCAYLEDPEAPFDEGEAAYDAVVACENWWNGLPTEIQGRISHVNIDLGEYIFRIDTTKTTEELSYNMGEFREFVNKYSFFQALRSRLTITTRVEYGPIKIRFLDIPMRDTESMKQRIREQTEKYLTANSTFDSKITDSVNNISAAMEYLAENF